MINIFEKIYLKILLFKDKRKDNNCLYYIILNTLYMSLYLNQISV